MGIFSYEKSIKIVDLMYGQYRSVIVCQKCGYRSVQFHPFFTTSLPLKNQTFKKIELNYIENHLTIHKLTVTYDKSWNWKMTDIMDDIKKQISKQKANLFVYVGGSYSSCELINLQKKVNDVKSQHKYRDIYVRQILNDQNIEKSLQIMIGNTICHSYYKDQTYRTTVSPHRLYFFDPNITLKQFHHKVVSYFSQIAQFKNYQKEVIEIDKDQQPIRLLGIATSRYSPCQFCSTKCCEGCTIPYTNQKLSDFVKNCDKQIQIEIYWRKNDKEIQKKFQEFAQGKRGGDKNDNGFVTKNKINLQNCFKFFSEAQTLSESSAWYCPKCTNIVQAKKQMQIYKAPKILILCLKRFKDKGYYQEKFKILVDFPVENFDISKFVISKNLPTHNLTQQEIEIEGPILYNLFGISNHFDGNDGGHYTAFCKNPLSGEWHDFDDNQVSKISNETALVTEHAYLLFYQRKQL